MQQELFLCDEVLHMNVDNLVERRARGGVNSAKFNTMILIALFQCNAQEMKRDGERFSLGVTKDTELLAEKHNLFREEEL